jgi:hypothetical protein
MRRRLANRPHAQAVAENDDLAGGLIAQSDTSFGNFAP